MLPKRYLDKVQDPEFTLRFIHNKDKVQSRIVAVDDTSILTSQHLRALKEIADSVGSF